MRYALHLFNNSDSGHRITNLKTIPMKNQILNYIIDHPKHNAITCGSIMGFLVSLDIHQIANTIILSIIGALSGYIATKLLELIIKRVKNKR